MTSEPPGGGRSSAGQGGLRASGGAVSSTWPPSSAPAGGPIGPHPESLDGLDPADSAGRIYQSFCEAARRGLRPDPVDFLDRYPAHAPALERLFLLHHAFDTVEFREFLAEGELPEPGDSIGPFELVRELGRGAFSRVFLSEQTDFDRRLVVLKVSNRPSQEPRLLARLRHPNIVNVVSKATADDGALHLLCMPFLGGATLAAVLARGRERGRPARSGLALLADFDAASAPEATPRNPGQLPSEVVSRGTYPAAIAWLVARLAAALDYADQRGVSHGDVKPSNILLSADFQPMLLDFNLGNDLRPGGDGIAADSPGDLGGTLAYMAPERLDRIVSRLSPPAAGPPPPTPAPLDRHRADLFSLGVVLREALTGEPPQLGGGGGDGGEPEEVAGRWAALRRSTRLGDGGRVPCGIAAILDRCLDPDPAGRYARGAELAADLDLWRTGEPFRHAREPLRNVWRREVINRRTMIAGLAATTLVALAIGALADRRLRGTLRDRAEDKLAMVLDRSNSGAFPIRRPGTFRVSDPLDPVDRAYSFLRDYAVLGPRDFRDQPEVSALPERDREDLIAFLMDQTIRYARALGEDDRRSQGRVSGVQALRRVATLARSEVLSGYAGHLEGRPSGADARGDLPDFGDLTELGRWGKAEGRPWREAYLAGVVLEPSHARLALACFERALDARPGFFWAQFRIAATASRLGDYRRALPPLRECLARRPANAVLHVQLAAVRYLLKSPDAIEEVDAALDLDQHYRDALITGALIAGRGGRSELVRSYSERLRRNDAARPLVEYVSRSAGGDGDPVRIGLDSIPELTRRFQEADPRPESAAVEEGDSLDLLVYQAARAFGEGQLDEA